MIRENGSSFYDENILSSLNMKCRRVIFDIRGPCKILGWVQQGSPETFGYAQESLVEELTKSGKSE